MSDLYAKPYLYDQTNDVIATYEGKARERLINAIKHATNSVGWTDEQTSAVIENSVSALLNDVANEIWLSDITYE
jgi:hypothetical protein